MDDYEETPMHEAYLAYIQAGVVTLGFLFFAAALWFNRLDPSMCVVVILALLSQYTRAPISLGGLPPQVKAFRAGQLSVQGKIEPTVTVPEIRKGWGNGNSNS